LTGVFLSETPWSVSDGAKGDEVLRVTIPPHVDLMNDRNCTPLVGSRGDREWVVRADVIHSQDCSVELISDEDD
jgi:hypothetical protein